MATQAKVINLTLLFLCSVVVDGCMMPTVRVTPGTSVAVDGLTITINSMVDFRQYVDAVITLQNKGERTLVIMSSDIVLVDADGNSAVPGDVNEQFFRHNAPEQLSARSRREQILPTGAQVTIQFQFMGDVDSDRLKAIRIRDSMGGRTLEVPLPLQKKQ